MAEKLKILVVDDNKDVTDIISRILSRENFQVIQLNKPEKIEEMILGEDFNLVITDLMMPEVDGFEVLEIIKSAKPDIPVVVLTGHGTIQKAVEATKRGAADFLSKPISKDDLIQVAKKYVSLKEELPPDIMGLMEDEDSFGRAPDQAMPEKFLLPTEIVSTATTPPGFVEINFQDIVPGQFLSFPLYLQILNRKTQKLFLRKILNRNTVFTTGLHEILKKRRLGSAYIREKDYPKYLEYLKALKSSPEYHQKRIRDEKRFILYGKTIETITDILAGEINNKKIQSAINLVDDLAAKVVEDPVTYQSLHRLFVREASLFRHSANVCLLTVNFGFSLKFKYSRLVKLGLGALFHDVGLNQVDVKILNKPSALTEDEWREIKLHPKRGYTLLRDSSLISTDSLRIIFEHHEREDGSGYPRGLEGEQISPDALFVRLVDRFDSLTTKKPYREAQKPVDALKRIYLDAISANMKGLIKKFILFLGGALP